jgi:tripartite-type tricarboxylate transporter receptor subunit TctC
MSVAARPKLLCSTIAATVAAGLLAAPAFGQSAEQYYKGKQLRMVIGSGAGGGYDAYARVLSRHMAAHIPGKPNIVDQNMPGASGMAATNWGFKVAPKDGTVIVATYNALLLEPLFGNKAADYDVLQYQWIGSISKQQNICMTWHTSPIKTIEQAKEREIVVSATGATGNSATLPKIVNAMLGTKFKVVGGYSTTESRLAVERGEAEGICGLSWSTLKASNPDWVQNNRMNVLLQTGMKPQAELPKVPLLYDKVTDADDKKILDLLFVSEDMGRPFVMPPGTPGYLVTAIRRAFDATMTDPAFIAEAEKAKLEIDPVTGEEMTTLLRNAYGTPKSLIDKAAELMGRQTKG